MNLPTFDELYVLSDLHLGGTKGFQIFTSTKEAKALLAELAGRPAELRVCLVINGDLVDFLAEPGAQSFNPDTAEGMLRRIAGDDAFKPVFDGLREFVAKPNHYLAINLGNHDIELSLPWVRAALLEILAGADDAARGRVELVFEGTGYAAFVGKARVLCMHGNEVDEWNVTAFETLRKQGRDRLQGKGTEVWKPNAGSRMVVEVMNEIKHRWPFVDLLKPEQEAVPMVLMALDSSLVGKLRDIAGLKFVASGDAKKMKDGLLGEPRTAVVESAPVNPFAEAELKMREKLQMAEVKSGDDLLAQAEASFKQKKRPVELIGRDREQEYLGLGGATLSLLKGNPPYKVVWAALDGLIKDESFVLTNADSTFTGVDARVGPGFDFVVTGHTHLERARPRTNGGFYYNGGTWVGLMQLTKDVMEDAEKFKPIFERMGQATLAALEAEPSLVMRHNSFVKISKVAGGTRGELLRAQFKGATFNMEQVPNSEHTTA
ncbi:metallophosphoesterase [Prosthecobacter sp.]|uniref:metallophosphoesterase n=1 Tax=Prosthecobacter sp. TaxID=1965333 RepID=UPI0037845C22